jgi:hypothetical protein
VPLWTGELQKAGAPRCRLRVNAWSAWMQQQSGLWGPALNVDHRLAYDRCLKRWDSTPPSDRGWATMQPEEGGEAGCEEYAAWCEQMQKAGALKLRSQGQAVHVLILMPASEDRNAQVGAPVDSNGLLALMFPN